MTKEKQHVVGSLILLVILFSKVTSNADYTIWGGPKKIFTKTQNADWTLPENQDRITEKVWITGDNKGLFNFIKELNYENNEVWQSQSPLGTRWAYGSTSTLANNIFYSWSFWSMWVGDCVNQNAVLYLTEDKIYMDIKFLSFNISDDHFEFSYERTDPKVFLTIHGNRVVYLKKGEPYKELGATATNINGTSLNVSISGAVNTNEYGDYVITYTTVDEFSGYSATGQRIVKVVSEIPKIWDSNFIIFNQPDGADWSLPENQDRLSENVWLTRKGAEGLINAKKETASNFDSPVGIFWAYGTLDEIDYLFSFDNAFIGFSDVFCSMHNGDLSPEIGKDIVVYLYEDNIYFQIKFLSWSSADIANPGFSYIRTSPNYYPPTLNSVSKLYSATNNMPFTISYEMLSNAADENDPDGNKISFRIESVINGTLWKDGQSVNPGSTLLSHNETIVWFPPINSSIEVLGFTIKAFDGKYLSSNTLPVYIHVIGGNNPPTLTFVNTLFASRDNLPFAISFNILANAANESDSDGDQISFRIESVHNGTLTKNGFPIIPGKTLFSEGENLIWMPGDNFTSGDIAFDIVAFDGKTNSSPPVPVRIAISAINSPPVLTRINTLSGAKEDEPFIITYDSLALAANESDPDNDVISFKVKSVLWGILTKNGKDVIPDETLLLPGESLTWIPPANYNGAIPAFTVVAYDGQLESTPPLNVNINVQNINDNIRPYFFYNPNTILYTNYTNEVFYFIRHGDLDSDGHLDLILKSTSFVRLLKGDGKGEFTDWKFLEAPKGMGFLIVTNFNNDDLLDIAVSGESNMSIFCNKNNGEFVLLGNYLMPTLLNYGVAINYKTNKYMDIALCTGGDMRILLLRNNGDGIFSQYKEIFLGKSIYNFDLGDINNDHLLDFIVPGYNPSGYTITFIVADNEGDLSIHSFFNIKGNSIVKMGYLNEDSYIDMVITTRDEISVYFGDGNGHFTLDSIYYIGPTCRDFSIVDLDKDNKNDIVLVSELPNYLRVYKNIGNGKFLNYCNEPGIAYYLPGKPKSLTVADFNEDGDPDVAVVGEYVKSGNTNGFCSIFLNSTQLRASTCSYTILEDSVLEFSIDVWGNPLSLESLENPLNGTLMDVFLLDNKIKGKYIPNKDFSSNDLFNYTITDGKSKKSKIPVKINVLPVNDPPSFDIKFTSIVINEDSPQMNITDFAYNINKGAENERSQPIMFKVENDNPSLFSIPPMIRLNGTLIFKPAPNAHGRAIVTAYLVDGGGTANGGRDTSDPKTFVIDVININDPPVLKPLDKYFINRTEYEDTYSDGGYKYNFGVTDLETPPENLTLTVTSTNQSLVPNSNIQISVNGTNRIVTVTPVANAFGTTLLTFTLSDGTNSMTKTSLLRVMPVNDEPYFELLSDSIRCMANVARYTGNIINMSTLSVGPQNESNQSWTFQIVNNSNSSAFSTLPVINKNGVLTFTPKKGFTGTVTLGIKMVDNGGVSYGGKNSYGPVNLTIEIYDYSYPLGNN